MSNLQGLHYLEQEISSLGGTCAATLMKKDLVLPATGMYWVVVIHSGEL